MTGPDRPSGPPAPDPRMRPIGEISIVVNGKDRVVPAGTTVDGVLVLLGSPLRGVAVAVNGEVTPRSSWRETAVRPGDRVEVLTAAQGG